MVVRKKTVEPRKTRRYKAVEGAYAAIISSDSYKLGQIIYISMGGLCFKYIDTNHRSPGIRPQQEESVFLSSMEYYVGPLPFKTISDYEVSNEPSFYSLKIRKRHIQFTDLNLKQLFDLDVFLRNNVSEKVEETFPTL